MSNTALQVLVGTALTNQRFCEGLLNGSRRRLLADFDLTDEEKQAVMTIDAASIQEFAARLCDWLEVTEATPSRASTAVIASQPLWQSPAENGFRSACSGSPEKSHQYPPARHPG